MKHSSRGAVAIALVACLSLLEAFGLAGPSWANHGAPSFCNAGQGSDYPLNMTRWARGLYAQTILGTGTPDTDQGEAYHYGNACWYNDNVASWNSLGAQQEGTDCSGFVSKVWGLRSNFTTNGGWHDWPNSDNTRPGGFYTGSAYGVFPNVGDSNASFTRIAYSSRQWMDHVSSANHDAIVWTPNYMGSAKDLTIEATGTLNQSTRPGSGYRVNNYSTMQTFARKNWG